MNTIERRHKLRRLEVLQTLTTGGRTREWYEEMVPLNDPHNEDRGRATRELIEIGLKERDENYPAPNHPHPYRITTKGVTFLEDVRKQIGKDNGLQWNRAREIEFP